MDAALADRRRLILQAAERHGRVFVDDLAAQLGVSAHTVRRDINHLCEENRLRRLHGGAAFVATETNIPYGSRAVLNVEAKRRIAAAAAALIPDGSAVFLSIGTTPALVATALKAKTLTVITNNLNAATALAENDRTRIIIPGGEIRLPDRDLLNEAAIGLFSAYRADFGVYGVGGIDADGTLLDFHEAEVRARQEIRRHCHTALLVADASKFGRRAAAAGGTLAEADRLVIDRMPAAPFDALAATLRERVLVADGRERPA